MRRNILAWDHKLLVIDLYVTKLLVVLLLLHELLDLLLLHHLLHLHLLHILLLLLRVVTHILLDSVHHVSVLVWISFDCLVLRHHPRHCIIHCNVEATVVLVLTCNLSIVTIVSSVPLISVTKPRRLPLFVFRLNTPTISPVYIRWFGRKNWVAGCSICVRWGGDLFYLLIRHFKFKVGLTIII